MRQSNVGDMVNVAEQVPGESNIPSGKLVRLMVRQNVPQWTFPLVDAARCSKGSKAAPQVQIPICSYLR